MDAVGLALGILPVVIEAIKAYRSASEKLHVFRDSSKELQRIYNKFRVQKCFFENECTLLLVSATDKSSDARAMLVKTSHPLWTDYKLDQRLRDRLGNSFDACKLLISDIDELLSRFYQIMSSLDILSKERRSVRRCSYVLLEVD